MVVEKRDGDNIRLGTIDKARATDESTPTQTDVEEAAERVDSEDADISREDAIRTKSAIAGGATLGAASVATETARRLGTDRHAEAGFAERAYAKAYAKNLGGTVVDDRTSAFTPDGGIDSIVKTTSGQKYIQSKHYGQRVWNSTLEQYAGDIDAIGATNGVAESADPAAYNMDIVTPDDWSWRAKVELQGRRVIRGFRMGGRALWNGARFVASRLIDGAKFVGNGAVTGGKWLCRSLVKIGSATAAWVARRSLLTQLVLAVVVVGLLYLLWRWYISEDEETVGA